MGLHADPSPSGLLKVLISGIAVRVPAYSRYVSILNELVFAAKDYTDCTYHTHHTNTQQFTAQEMTIQGGQYGLSLHECRKINKVKFARTLSRVRSHVTRKG